MARNTRRRLRSADRAVVRSPLLPVSSMSSDAARDREGTRAVMRRLLDDAVVREAIWLASPSLAGQIDRWREQPDSDRGRGIERSLWKYLVRMATRSTPFGTFSGVSVAGLGRDVCAELGATLRRRTRVDNDYLFALADELVADRGRREGLRWYPNSSLYRVAGQVRYAEARVVGRDRSYHLVSVEPTWYLDAVLAAADDGASIAELAAHLEAADDEIDDDEARDYIHDLIDAQVLVCRLGVTVTGREPIDAFIDEARAGALTDIADALAGIREDLAAIDRGGLGHADTVYVDLGARLTGLTANPDREVGRLFQVDLARPTTSITLPPTIARDVADACERVARVFPSSPDPSIGRFADEFTARYEDAEVPLAEALDEDTGIGFERSDAPGAEGSPLLAGLAFPPAPGEPTTAFDARERALASIAFECAASGARELELDDAVLARLGASERGALPTGTSALVRIAAPSASALANGDYRVLFRGAGGPSGAQLLGRFCWLDDDIHDLVRSHLRAEEASRPGARFAEIVHLNEGRIGNIQCRPVLRDLEIAFLGLSGCPQQLPITDLTVSVRRGRVVVRSRSLDCEVIPRLSTAHNFRLRSLGVYRFLCALQSREGGGVGWSWGPAGVAPFLPRVTSGRVVLSRARWRLGAAEVEPITRAVRAGGSAAAMADLRERLGLPRHVALANGDNELAIDLDDELAAEVLAHELAGSTGPDLVELFPAPDQHWLAGPDGVHASEVALLFHQPVEAEPVSVPARTGPVAYAPGSEWLYAKVYTGFGSVDRVLGEAITPLLDEARAAGIVDRWFFLRYGDPDPHLRVRFHGDPVRLGGELLPALHRGLDPLQRSGLVARVQLDTYRPEVFRYGGPAALSIAERIFTADSDAVLAVVNLLEGDEGKDARWRLGLLGTHMLLEDLGFDHTGCRRVIASARESFGREFRVDAGVGRELGKRFRAETSAIDELLSIARDGGDDHWLAPGIEPLRARTAALAPLAAELRALGSQLHAPLDDIAWSLVHMHLNRMLHASQRVQELVIYDLLSRSYAARARR